MNNLPENKKIILFDGVCNLCDFFVQFIIKNDSEDIFRFVSLQSDLGKSMMSISNYNTVALDSVVLYNIDSKIYKIKSVAVFEILSDLNRFIFLVKICALFPVIWTDFFYKIIARYRYLLFGKKDQCLIPNPDIISKFL